MTDRVGTSLERVPSRLRGRLRGMPLGMLLAGAIVAGGPVAAGASARAPVPPPATAPPPAPAPAVPVLAPLPAGGPPPSPGGLAAVLNPPLAAEGLGTAVGATVLDPVTGGILYDRAGTVPLIPASVTKIATAAAALEALGPDHRLATTVVTGVAPGEVLLVGAGDATLTARSPAAGSYPRWAALAELADQTVRRLRRQAPAAVTVRVDDTLFTGPSVSPAWRPTYVPEGVVAPVSALAVDGGRRDPAAGNARVPDPALDAGRRFASLLRHRGLRVAEQVRRGRAREPAEVLARVQSPPLDVIVEHMLSTSDNDVAESLARLAALAQGLPGSFAGVSDVLRAAVAGDGPPPPGVRLYDGSGLSRGSALTARSVTALLAGAASVTDPRPQLRPILSGLAVGGFSGTLAGRFAAGPARDGAGTVRAKTGTLNGVSSLAGQVVDAEGRLLLFAVLADEVASTAAARSALDGFAAALAGCGCGEPRPQPSAVSN